MTVGARKRVSIVGEERNDVQDAIPLIAAPAASTVLVEWASKRAEEAAFYSQPDAPAAPESPPKVSLLALLSFSTRRERWLMGFGILWAGVSGLAMPVWLLLLANSLDTFNNLGKIISTVGSAAAADQLKSQMDTLIWSFVILGVVSLFSGSFYVSLWTYTGERQALRIRQAFVRSAFRQDAKWFDSRGDPQELPTLAANALAKINDGIGRKIADTFANLLSSVVSLAVAIGLDAPLALMMLAILPVVAICIGILSFFLRRNSGHALEQYATAGAFASEVISGMKTVASLCVERWAVDRYAGTVRKAQGFSVRSGFYTGLSAGIMGFLFYATYSYSFIFGTEQVANTGDVADSKLNPFYCMFNYCGISGAEVLACIYGVILCAQFFTMMAPGIQAINLARQAAVDIFDTIKRSPEIDASTKDGIELDGYDGNIEMKSVAFAYPSHPDRLIFKNINLRIEKGSSVALVGPSGSGKSTITKLLLRFYDPVACAVLADGVSLRDLNLKWWRSKIGYVPQQPHLFIGSIRDNIAAGKSSEDKPATDEEVFAAARAACADEFIRNLPDMIHFTAERLSKCLEDRSKELRLLGRLSEIQLSFYWMKRQARSTVHRKSLCKLL
jgi:ATP-binding cassette subfamily B (MDR/TAP) protein 1